MQSLLCPLTTDEFNDRVGFILPPAPFRRVLQQTPEVRRLEVALRFGQVTATMVRAFTDQLLSAFRSGEAFPHDVALAAIAVALEHWNDAFAEEYLIDLARINRPEFRIATRIARECLKARFSFPRTQVKTFVYPRGQSATHALTGGFRVMSHVTAAASETFNIRWLRYCEAIHA